MDHLERCLALAPDQKTFEQLCELMQANKLADPAVKPFIDSRPEAERHMTVEEGMYKIGMRDLLDANYRSASQYPLFCRCEVTPCTISADEIKSGVFKADICRVLDPPTILRRFRMMTDDEVVRFIRELSILLYETEYDLTNLWCSGNCPDEGDGCSDDRRDACIRRWLDSPYKGGEIIGLQ